VRHFTPFAAFLLLLTGCGIFTPFQARVNHQYAIVLENWREANPDVELTDEIQAHLQAKAEDEARGIENTERNQAISKATEAASSFGRGDIVGGILGVGGLLLIGLGAKKKRAEMLAAPTIEESTAADRTAQAARATEVGGQAGGGGAATPAA